MATFWVVERKDNEPVVIHVQGAVHTVRDLATAFKESEAVRTAIPDVRSWKPVRGAWSWHARSDSINVLEWRTRHGKAHVHMVSIPWAEFDDMCELDEDPLVDGSE